MSAGRHGPRRRDDAGTTLVELLVSSVVVTVVLVTVGLALTGMLRTTARLEATAAAQDDVRAATAALTRSLSAASLVNPPVTVGSDTYLEALTPAAGGLPDRCVQWRVAGSTGLVQSRSWSSGSTTATAWATVARGVVNTAAQPPFAVLPSDGDWAHARVVVDLRLQRTAGGVVPSSAVVALVNGSGADGGVAAEPVCTEAGRS